jgi:hypothetical protein
VLVALLLPAIQAAREAARRSSCQNNLRQIGIGLQNYLTANKMFPSGQSQFYYENYTWSWHALVLEYFEEAGIKSQIQFTYNPTTPQNKDVVGIRIPIFICPSTGRRDAHRGEDDRIPDLNHDGKWQMWEGMAMSDYAGNEGPSTSARNPITNKFYTANGGVLLGIGPLINPSGPPKIIDAPRIRPAMISDGLSNTMQVGEVTGRAWNYAISKARGGWSYGTVNIGMLYPINAPDTNTSEPLAWHTTDGLDGLLSDHSGGASLMCCDASVHFMSEETDVTLLQQLCSRDGNEVLPGDLLQ